jgi:hypothetical protein
MLSPLMYLDEGHWDGKQAILSGQKGSSAICPAIQRTEVLNLVIMAQDWKDKEVEKFLTE